MLAGITATIRGYRSDMEAMKGQLQEVEKGPNLASKEQEIDRFEAYLWDLRRAPGIPPTRPTSARSFGRWWTASNSSGSQAAGPHTICVFARGLIHLKADDRVIRLVTPPSGSLQLN